MLKVIAKPQAGQLKEEHGLRLVGEVIVDNLANSSSLLFYGICQHLAEGNLPNLRQHLVAKGLKALEEYHGKEVNLCYKRTRVA